MGLDLENLAAVAEPAIGNHQPPGCARLPFAFLPRFAPVLPGKLGIDERVPQFLGRRANVGHVDESRIIHRFLLPASS